MKGFVKKMVARFVATKTYDFLESRKLTGIIIDIIRLVKALLSIEKEIEKKNLDLIPYSLELLFLDILFRLNKRIEGKK